MIVEPNTYAQELHFKSEDDVILEFINKFPWNTLNSMTATPALYKWQVYEVLLKHFDLTEC